MNKPTFISQDDDVVAGSTISLARGVLLLLVLLTFVYLFVRAVKGALFSVRRLLGLLPKVTQPDVRIIKSTCRRSRAAAGNVGIPLVICCGFCFDHMHPLGKEKGVKTTTRRPARLTRGNFRAGSDYVLEAQTFTFQLSLRRARTRTLSRPQGLNQGRTRLPSRLRGMPQGLR